MMDFFEQVRDENVVKYGTRVSSYIPIIINQYSDRTHFIYEVLQNAEDAGATYIRFVLHKDRFVIFHNGRPFNERDIVGVCGIADGTKEDGTRIGHFGIGFKAVYGYTLTPEIYSGKYSFKIEDYLNPYEIKKKPELAAEETCLVLPFDKDSVTKEVAYSEIKEALTRKITAESILMLDSIAEVETSIDGYPEIICISKEKGPKDKTGNVFDLNIMTSYTNTALKTSREEEQNYLFFTDGEKEACAIIFKTVGKELIEVKNSKIFAFFPTAKEAHQSFYIHAPFDTTPARDNFKEGAEFGGHNIKLVKNICKLITYAFIWLRNNGYLTFAGLNKVYPIYEYEETDILRAIYQNSIDIIRDGEPLLPTNEDGVYKSIDEICVPENMGIVNVFSDTDLQRLIGNRKIFWLSKEISTKEYGAFKSFLDDNFDFKTYEWRHLVLKMTASYLKEKDLVWTERLMGNIESFCIRRSSQQSSHYIDVSEIPFVRLSNGEHICARKDGKLQVYLNNPAVCKLKILEAFRNNDTIRSFYERALGIPNYDLERETIDKILPKYTTKNVAFKSDDHIRENIEDLKEIKDAISMNPLILEQVAERYIVTDGKEWYRPSELYIRSGDVRSGYDLIRGIVDIKYLASSYFDDTVMTIRLDEDFFKKIGCSLGVRIEQTTKEAYLRALGKYCGSQAASDLRAKVMSKYYISKKFDWSFNFEGFPEVFKDMTPEKSMKIARFVNMYTTKFDIQGELVGADDQNFSGKNVDSSMAYSMLGLQLCYEKWVYINGNPNPQSPIDVDREDLIKGYEPAKRLMAMIPFKEVKNALFDYLESMFDDKGDLALVKQMMSDPTEFLKLAKQKAKSEAKLEAQAAKKGSLEERLKNGDKNQKGEKPEEDNGGLEVNPISAKALEKRTQKLEEELTASLGEQIKVTRGAYFTRRECDPNERAFLQAEYDGRCQICVKKITKWNNEPYFEAINIIKPSTMFDNLSGSLGLGWNSLCLCPNCAAEYNYCSKRISNIYEQVMSTKVEPDSEEAIGIDIELPQGKTRTIRYSPRHFLALKKAFEVFTKSE